MAAVTSVFRGPADLPGAHRRRAAAVGADLRPVRGADVVDVQSGWRPAAQQGGRPAAGPSHQRDERREPAGGGRAHHPSAPPDGRSHHAGSDHPGGPPPGRRRHGGRSTTPCSRIRASILGALEDLVSALQELRRRAGDFAAADPHAAPSAASAARPGRCRRGHAGNALGLGHREEWFHAAGNLERIGQLRAGQRAGEAGHRHLTEGRPLPSAARRRRRPDPAEAGLLGRRRGGRLTTTSSRATTSAAAGTS